MYCIKLQNSLLSINGSQVLQPSTGPICLNKGQITPSVRTSHIRNSKRSSFPQPSSRNSPICSDVHAKKQADKETLVRQGSKGTAYNNVVSICYFIQDTDSYILLSIFGPLSHLKHFFNSYLSQFCESIPHLVFGSFSFSAFSSW